MTTDRALTYEGLLALRKPHTDGISAEFEKVRRAASEKQLRDNITRPRFLPPNPRDYVALARHLEEKKGDLTEAAKWYWDAIQLDVYPNSRSTTVTYETQHYQALLAYAAFLERREQFVEAEQYRKKAEEFAPEVKKSEDVSPGQLAAFYMRQGQFEDAREKFETILEDPESHRLGGDDYTQVSRYQHIRIDYAECLFLLGEPQTAWNITREILHELGASVTGPMLEAEARDYMAANPQTGIKMARVFISRKEEQRQEQRDQSRGMDFVAQYVTSRALSLAYVIEERTDTESLLPEIPTRVPARAAAP